MARPRVFVSSTFYDLKHVRNDLERFIQSFGYDPILHEKGHIAYGSEEELETYCYREISRCDILVSVVGSRYGSPSRIESHSISQMELKTALDLGKQVYIFVERLVDVEFNTFLINKGNHSTKYAAVDDVKIYEFIDFIRALPVNNAMLAFDSVEQICNFLREQWSGLFQRLLQESAVSRDLALATEMRATSQTLNEMVSFLVRESRHTEKSFREIIFANNPIFLHLRKITKATYRVYFTTRDEMNDWLTARQWRYIEEWSEEEKTYQSWLQASPQRDSTLIVNMDVFDEGGRLKAITQDEWDDDFVRIEHEDKVARRTSASLADELDDDIPF